MKCCECGKDLTNGGRIVDGKFYCLEEEEE